MLGRVKEETDLFTLLAKLPERLQAAVIAGRTEPGPLSALVSRQRDALNTSHSDHVEAVPPEVMTDIFRKVVMSDDPPSSERALALVGVCKRWKEIAESDAVLWGDVLFGSSTQGWTVPAFSQMIDKAEALGRRGRARRVWIHGTTREVGVALWHIGRKGLGSSIVDLKAVMGRATLREFWDALETTQGPVLETIYLEDGSDIPLDIPPYAFGRLHTLEMKDINISPNGNVLAFLARMPALRALSFENVRGCDFSAASGLGQAASLSLLETCALTEIVQTGLTSLYQLLSRSPALRSLKIRHCENVHLVLPGDESDVLSWPSLTEITLAGNKWSMGADWRLGVDIPFDIVAPQLESLEISDDTNASYRPLLFPSTGGPNIASLQALDLRQSAPLSVAEVTQLVADMVGMVSLETLFLVDVITDEDRNEGERRILQGLTLASGEGPHCCPEMRRLALVMASGGVVEVPALLGMIRSRHGRVGYGVAGVERVVISMEKETKTQYAGLLKSMRTLTDVRVRGVRE